MALRKHCNKPIPDRGTALSELGTALSKPGTNLSRPGTIRPCNPAVDIRAIETPDARIEVSDLTYEAEA